MDVGKSWKQFRYGAAHRAIFSASVLRKVLSVKAERNEVLAQRQVCVGPTFPFPHDFKRGRMQCLLQLHFKFRNVVLSR